jgi:hypothetical protein
LSSSSHHRHHQAQTAVATVAAVRGGWSRHRTLWRSGGTSGSVASANGQSAQRARSAICEYRDAGATSRYCIAGNNREGFNRALVRSSQG